MVADLLMLGGALLTAVFQTASQSVDSLPQRQENKIAAALDSDWKMRGPVFSTIASRSE
jgi:hypothetical protein